MSTKAIKAMKAKPDSAIDNLLKVAREIDECFKNNTLSCFGVRASKARHALSDALKGLEP